MDKEAIIIGIRCIARHIPGRGTIRRSVRMTARSVDTVLFYFITIGY